MKLSRREWASVAGASLTAQAALGQTPPAAPDTDLAKAVHDAILRNSAALSNFEVPAGTEPAFLFKP
jgi:hypothetical protein